MGDSKGRSDKHFGEAFDALISKELMDLSVSDRNDFQEEIHGVKCLAPEETPAFLEESLRKMAYELEEVLPDSEKKAYILSQSQSPASKAYINSRDFRLRFLRFELFDVRKAAERMAVVCDCLLTLFGSYALERPIQLSDFTKSELTFLRKGRVQPLPFRDRSGRRIFVFFLGKANAIKADTGSEKTIARALQLKIFIYFSFALSEDVEVQRRGIVAVVWLDPSLKSTLSPDITRIHQSLKSHKASVLRASALHVCSPNTPFFRAMRSMLLLGAGKNRNWLRLHLGEPTELRYQLNGYGINTETLPISWTGTVKNAYLKQWMAIRVEIENPRLPIHSPQSPIESPRLNDVLFKQGTSAMNHPGNVRFRGWIEQKCEEYGVVPIESLIQECMERIERGEMRVLIWDQKLSWWCILNDKREVQKKIEKSIVSFWSVRSLEVKNIACSTAAFRKQQQQPNIMPSCIDPGAFPVQNETNYDAVEEKRSCGLLFTGQHCFRPLPLNDHPYP